MRWLRAALAFVATTALAMPLIYFVAITIAPPVTSDGHPVMPIGQAGIALVGAPILGLLAATLLASRRR